MASPVISVRPATMFVVECEYCGVVRTCSSPEVAQAEGNTHYRVYHMPAKIESTEEVDEDSGD